MCPRKTSDSSVVSLLKFLLTLCSPDERLVGERVVVKEIEIFGNFWFPKVGEGKGGQIDGEADHGENEAEECGRLRDSDRGEG
jgi:hypothetical protein